MIDNRFMFSSDASHRDTLQIGCFLVAYQVVVLLNSLLLGTLFKPRLGCCYTQVPVVTV